MSLSSPGNPAQIQRRTLRLLVFAQIFSGLGNGAVVSVGSLLAAQLSGDDAWAGTATTAMTLGAAFAAIPLARLAALRGRRQALAFGLMIAASGSLLIILAGTVQLFWLLLLGAMLVGLGGAANLQARFAATDLSQAEHKGRDLSLIVWMSTVGSVAGPNLIGVTGDFAESIGLPALVGIFILATLGMIAAMLIIWIGLRPDPYLLSLQLSGETVEDRLGEKVGFWERFARTLRHIAQRRTALVGLISLVIAHLTMVGLMAMTPIHLQGHGTTLQFIGLTISLHVLGMYGFSPIMGYLSDTIGAYPTTLIGHAITLVSAVMAAMSGENYFLATTALFLLGVGWSASTVSGATMLTTGVDSEHRLGAQGVSDSLMGFAGATGGALSGVLIALAGYEGLSIIAAVIVVLVMLLLLALMRSEATKTPRS